MLTGGLISSPRLLQSTTALLLSRSHLGRGAADMVGPINIREILDAYQTRKWVEIGFEFECVRCQSVGLQKPEVKQGLGEHTSERM